jgi:hypothetical protein
MSMAEHMESSCTTKGGFLPMVCCIGEDSDNRYSEEPKDNYYGLV